MQQWQAAESEQLLKYTRLKPLTVLTAIPVVR